MSETPKDPPPEKLVVIGLRPETVRALRDVRDERMAQDAHWGWPKRIPELSPGAVEAGIEIEHSSRLQMEEFGASWDAILLEEVGEAISDPDPSSRRAELIQVAAVALAWAENLGEEGS